MGNSNFVETYPGVFIIIAAVIANFLAQIIKFITYRIDNGKWCLAVLLSTGGMPSSHSAFVVSALVGVMFTDGITSTVFAVSFVITAVVLNDASGIRRHAGKQARVLNKIVEDFVELTQLLQKENILENDTYNKKLKEFLGHEPIEVIGGSIFGAIVSVILYLIFINIYV